MTTKPTRETVSDTANTFNRAESHLYFSGTIKRRRHRQVQSAP
jgi:hypothetical protein